MGLLAAIALAASCTPTDQGGGTGAPDQYRLFTNLVDDGFEVSWNPTPIGQANGYQIQVLQQDPPVGTWRDLQPPELGVEPEIRFTEVSAGTTYMFRVREAGAPGQPAAAWSSIRSALFVEPVLPVIRIDTENHAPIVEKTVQIPMTASFEPNGSAFAAVSGSGTIKGRGNSTWLPAKKPYQIKFDSKVSLMGMTKAKKWVLLANYYDPSQLRTYTASKVSQVTSLAWTPGYKWVEVVLNGQYVGLYQLAEKIERDKDKVNIEKMNPEDIEGEALTGGYLLQIEGRLEQKDELGWRINDALAIAVEDPDPPTPEQLDYIKNYVNAFHAVVNSRNFADPVNGYAKYLDVPSFIDYWLVQETLRNSDGMWDSTYFYKKRNDPKLYFGPIWDFDLSMGNPSTAVDTSPNGWATLPGRPWPRAIVKDPAFIQQVNARWNQLLPQISQIPAEILAVAPDLDAAKVNERARWGKQKGPQRPQDEPQYLADWLNARIAWMTTTLADWAAGNVNF